MIKEIIKLIISIVFGVLLGSYYMVTYNFSIEAATISSLISMVFALNMLNLIWKDAVVSE